MPTTTVLDPVARPAPVAGAGARPGGRLAGARIAVLDNTKPNAVEMMERIAQVLVRDHGATSYEVLRKLSASQGASEEQLARIAAGFDLVVTGSGDCGSCSSWSALDAAELERRGVTAVLLVTEPFVPLVDTLVGAEGAEIRRAVVAHPIGGRPTAAMLEVAEAVVGSVVAQLDSTPARPPSDGPGTPDVPDIRETPETPDPLAGELAELRSMLGTNGFGLQPTGRRGDTVDLRITVVSPEACADCLVPEPMMRTIVTARLAPSGLALGELAYPVDGA